MAKDQRYETAVAAKEALIREAEELAATNDFRGGHQRAQALMRRWKAAGHAGPANDELWSRFKTAQDRFYTRMRKQRAAHPEQPRDRSATSRPGGGQGESVQRRIANLERIFGQIQFEIGVLDSEIRNIETALYYAGGHNRAADARLNKQILKKQEIRQKKWQRLAFFGGELDAARAELARLG